MINLYFGVFTLPDTEAYGKKWPEWNCVEESTLHRDRYQQRFSLGSVPILLILISDFVSVTVCVKTFIKMF